MSDAQLRELERRWRETGSVDDEAAWLRARQRAGLLDEQVLRRRARLGDPAAHMIMDCEEAPIPEWTLESEHLLDSTRGTLRNRRMEGTGQGLEEGLEWFWRQVLKFALSSRGEDTGVSYVLRIAGERITVKVRDHARDLRKLRGWTMRLAEDGSLLKTLARAHAARMRRESARAATRSVLMQVKACFGASDLMARLSRLAQ